MDGVGDTPQTVMTTRAPAVLKTQKILSKLIISEPGGGSARS